MTGLRSLRPTGARLRSRARSFVVRLPRVHELAMRIRGQRRGFVDVRTKIVIEGFFRSGNTYALAAFRVANPRGRMGGRLHAPAIVRRAVRLGKPTLVLIRRPEDAVVSLTIRLPEVSVRQALADYVSFYRGVLPMRSGFVLADFERVVADFGSVIRSVNERFGTSFSLYERTEENEKRCVELIERWDRDERGDIDEMRVPRPSEERHHARDRLRRSLQEPATKKILDEAERLYRELVATAER